MRMVVKFIWERNRSHKLGKFFAEGQGVERWAIRLWVPLDLHGVSIIPLELHSVSIRI